MPAVPEHMHLPAATPGEGPAGERARLRTLLARPARESLRLPSDLEQAYARHHHELALANLQTYWPLVVGAVLLIASLVFLADIVTPDMAGLVIAGFATMFGVIGMVVAGALVPRLHGRLEQVVALATFLGLSAMHIATLLAPDGNALRHMAEYGVVFITVAACTISNLVFRRALSACLAALGCLLVVAAGSGLAPDWGRFPFYALGSLLIGAILGFTQEIRERTVFLQQRLLAVENDELEGMARTLAMMSRQDALTGLANRRHFDEVAGREWAGCQREARAFNVLFIDVDHFKPYNDRYGHTAGDACLARVGAELGGQALRGGDLVARYGGEEFVAIFPGTSREGLLTIARRMIEAVDALALPHEASPVSPHVTVSIGVASVPATREGSLEAALNAADEALYEAKRRGRHVAVARWELA